MSLFDSHCHIDRFFHNGTLEEVFVRARVSGVDQLVAIGTEPEDWKVYRDLTKAYPEKMAYTVGLHPNEVEEGWPRDIETLKDRLALDPAPVAIGEIGLDYFRLPKEEAKAATPKALQKAAFARQLEMAKEANLPVVIHCRASFGDCVRMIDESGVDWGKVVFHCFSEGSVEMERLLERGGRASFTGIITYGNAENVRQAALAQGMDNLMLETDSPYLSPEPVRGKPNEPANLRHIAEFCAALFNTDLESLSCRTTVNAKAFYGLD
ncbi:MAG: TatD family hydrolase [Opitutales bacterium]